MFSVTLCRRSVFDLSSQHPFLSDFFFEFLSDGKGVWERSFALSTTNFHVFFLIRFFCAIFHYMLVHQATMKN